MKQYNLSLIGFGLITRSVLVTAAAVTLTAAAEASAGSHSETDTYSNSEYRFELKHPKNIKPSTKFDSFYFGGTSWSLADDRSGGREKGEGVQVVNFDIGSQVALRVGIRKASTEAGACTTTGEQTSSVEINRVRFQKLRLDDAAMSHYLKGNSYQTFGEGTCYAVECFSWGTNPDVLEGDAAANMRAIQKGQPGALERCETIVQSFTFK